MPTKFTSEASNAKMKLTPNTYNILVIDKPRQGSKKNYEEPKGS